MKRISPVLYLGALILSLVFAFLTWTQGPKKMGGEVTALECGKGDLQELTLREKNRRVTFARKENAWSGRTSWWVEASRVPFSPAEKRDNEEKEVEETLATDVESVSPAPEEPSESRAVSPAAQAGGTSGEKNASGEEGWVVVEAFKGNKKLEEAMADFCPWKALRDLGTQGEEKREEFGLKDTEDFITLGLTAGQRRFLIGETTFGPKDRYVEDEKTGEIFLIKGQNIKDLLYPKSRYMERNLHAFKQIEVARLWIRSGGREKELIHKVSENGDDQGWADSGTPDETKEIYKNWIRKLLQLRPSEYVVPGKGEAVEAARFGCAAPQGSETLASFTFLGEKEEIGFLTIYRKEDDKGKTDFYACTENTGALVKISKTQSENLMEDMEDILGES